MIAVQGKGSDPLTRAWKTKTRIIPISNPATSASAMKVGDPLDGELTVSLVFQSGGFFSSVSDKKMSQAQALLAKHEGIFVELSAAATVATLPLVFTKLPNKAKIVLILTGSGLKEAANK